MLFSIIFLIFSVGNIKGGIPLNIVTMLILALRYGKRIADPLVNNICTCLSYSRFISYKNMPVISTNKENG